MNVKTLTLAEGLPKSLGQLSDAPTKLYMRGSFDFSKKTLAVVGTRSPSTYASTVISQLINALKPYDIGIVSGLALGCDGLAHKAALTCGLPTIAVLANGIETIYPRTHHRLGEQIIQEGGALISEYPGKSEPYKHQFIARNRIIAGLADAVLIPEAASGSGSLHTAQFALDLGIEVLAVPGLITSEKSVGTNNLLKTGARFVTSALDILEALSIQPASAQQERLVFDTPEQAAVYKALKESPADIDSLQNRTQLESTTLQNALTMLELQDAVRCQAGIWSL